MNFSFIFPKDSEGFFDSAIVGKFGGATVRIYELAKELSKRKNINVQLLYPETRDEPDMENTSVFLTFAANDSVLKKIIKFHQAVNRAKPDFVLQCGLSPAVPYLSIYLRLRRIKFIYLIASDKEAEERYQESQKKCITFPLLMQNKYIITQTRYQYERLRKKYSNIHFITKSNNSSIFEKTKGEFILWVGRGVAIKRPDLYIELAKRFENEKFIMIMPEGKDLAYYNKIKTEAEKQKNIEFITYVPYRQIGEYFRKSKVFVNTSEFESIPNTFLESAMAGTPILSLKVNPNHIFSWNIGYCCSDDIKEMFRSFEKLITDLKQHEKMSCNINKLGDQLHLRHNVDGIIDIITN